jgi:hypothetical protein
MRKYSLFGIPAAALIVVLLALVAEPASAQVCLHYRNHPSGGCGTPCICDDCLDCGTGDG